VFNMGPHTLYAGRSLEEMIGHSLTMTSPAAIPHVSEIILSLSLSLTAL
uniref:Uncharacterized protein n=1 Tax=Triticum urartu TaxID=4572 RepID=A0A8R7Q9K3_TRIUA